MGTPLGRVSYAFRFRFTQSERPLTADELNGAIETVAARIEIGARRADSEPLRARREENRR
jgi:phenylalanyl-tRNA synthetase beta subunit